LRIKTAIKQTTCSHIRRNNILWNSRFSHLFVNYYAIHKVAQKASHLQTTKTLKSDQRLLMKLDFLVKLKS